MIWFVLGGLLVLGVVVALVDLWAYHRGVWKYKR